jgi:hypothetical protein
MSRFNPDRTTERYAYIETELIWGDGLTARRLAQAFGITRQAAQGVIDQYRRNFPGQLRYDGSLKRHMPDEDFKACFIRENAIAFLDYLRGQALVGMFCQGQDWSDLTVTDVDRLLRSELPGTPVRKLMAALKSHLTVMIDYRSKDLKPGSMSVRVISPNNIVFADDRYHIRAYCHKRHRYLDFVLSRVSHAEMADAEWISPEDDWEWNEYAELHVQPNPVLPPLARDAILMGFATNERGVRIIKCRKALLFYIKRKLLAADNKYGVPLWQIVPNMSAPNSVDNLSQKSIARPHSSFID